MTKRKSHPPLNVVLWGRVAAQGRRLLQGHMITPCRFFAFPTPAKEGTLPRELAQADAVVASAFSESMAAVAPRLKLLHAPGAGVDGFCLKALGPQTTVANAYFHGPAIGEYVMMTVLALSRDLLKMDAHFRRGTWYGSWIWGTAPPAEIQGKTLGLVGYGHIGKEVADRARAFGMKVWVVSAHPPAQKPRNIDFYEGPGSLHKLLKAADYLVLACPLNEITRGLMGKREFSSMKRSAFLINVARGPVGQQRLAQIGRSGLVAGIGGSFFTDADAAQQMHSGRCGPPTLPFPGTWVRRSCAIEQAKGTADRRPLACLAQIVNAGPEKLACVRRVVTQSQPTGER